MVDMENKKARVIAFYLPQYHAIPENDTWWGKGFTEWTNVGKAKPLFKGHYQPRVPADLGYYDLRMPEARAAQAEMADNAGVEGFMYWHYWFGNGRRILERPFNEVLSSGKPDYPFCLGWANHSWTNKTWETSARKNIPSMLMEQLYPGQEDYINHFYTVLKAFQDPRYLTVDGCPLFYIYDPFAIPDIIDFIDLWRNLAAKEGLKGIHFVCLNNGWDSNIEKLLALGFDAVNTDRRWEAETKLKGGKLFKLVDHNLKKILAIAPLDKYLYRKIIKHLISPHDSQDNIYPTILPQWDRTARAGNKAPIYHGSTPELFKINVNEVLNAVKDKPYEHKIIFLKSWNEWAEGNYVEPDLKFGHGYLDVLKETILPK